MRIAVRKDLNLMRLATLFATFVLVCQLHAQRPQDNWYQEKTWTKTGDSLVATNGGLNVPYGVAIGFDGKVYVGDEGYSRIQVYQKDGTFVFSITNNFGNGQSFSQPRGMVFGSDEKLYIADSGRNKVFVFSATGAFDRQIGEGSGSGPGQMSGSIDVGVSRSGEVFVLESARVSVFSTDGTFLRSWGGYGTLDGQLVNPRSIAVSPKGQVYICQQGQNNYPQYSKIKVFSQDGLYIREMSIQYTTTFVERGPCSIRFDDSGLMHVVVAPDAAWSTYYNYDQSVYSLVCNPEGGVICLFPYSFAGADGNWLAWPCSAVGRDGTIRVFCKKYCQGIEYRLALREPWLSQRNAIPQPTATRITQRANSSLVDIEYSVTDMDDTVVTAAILIFTNATQSLANCLRMPTLVENTSANLGTGVLANVTNRLTWNAGADWTTSLGSYRVAVLAKDCRQKLLDLHYLDLPAEHGMPALRISRSPLIENDFVQVWWWLLATGDTDIRLVNAKVYGNTGSYDGVQLWDGTTTSASGRAYLLAKMTLREATTAEVTWAKQASTVPTVEQWSPSFSVAGRPGAVNEYGFDTGNWGANAWWVVPLE